ncbi:helix-turn-helix domain-containing protein [Klebsiella quasipneumoniae]|uniref:helix-turn-helix domain-containing protein n=1 Tax=Klebsiella quasipneumoniae TaxID=1463165 RepID=UPI0021D8FA12|nr:helix-turn-helix transcriptional regulator [Klebsiella quasipneumoniae]MCU8824778.1 helix-turn-helix domain-containing protein [Klebsiella quasipneumoniae]
MNQGDRIKSERERLGFNQTDFAALAGASKHSQINWEKGVTFPNSLVLKAWCDAGLDLLYVVTGQRSLVSQKEVEKISPEKKELLDAFDGMTPEQRRAILEVGKGLSQPKPSKFAS